MRFCLLFCALLVFCPLTAHAEPADYLVTTATVECYTDSTSLTRELKDKMAADKRKVFSLNSGATLKCLRRTVHSQREYLPGKTTTGPRGERVHGTPKAFTKRYNLAYVKILDGAHKGKKAWLVESTEDPSGLHLRSLRVPREF